MGGGSKGISFDADCVREVAAPDVVFTAPFMVEVSCVALLVVVVSVLFSAPVTVDVDVGKSCPEAVPPNGRRDKTRIKPKRPAKTALVPIKTKFLPANFE